MKKTLFSLLVVGAVALGATPAVHAQSTDPAIVSIPFSFIVGGKVMPAGKYRITATGSGASALMIANEDKPIAAFTTVERAPNAAENTNETHVAFKTYMGQHFLWQVVTPGTDVREVALPSPQMDRVLARLNLLPAEPAGVSAK